MNTRKSFQVQRHSLYSVEKTKEREREREIERGMQRGSLEDERVPFGPGTALIGLLMCQCSNGVPF